MKFLLAFICFVSTVFTSCKKLVHVNAPETQLSGADVFNNDATATAAVLSIYIEMEKLETYAISLSGGLLSDEFESYEGSGPNHDMFLNALQPTNASVQNIWDRGYFFIYGANSVLEGLKSSGQVSPAVKQQLQGEALFMRAYWHFYLVNLFGAVPLVISSDYRVNALSPRTDPDSVYQFIIRDLINAAEKLSTQYLDADNNPSGERVRPNAATAKALLARVYLYQKNYAAAELASSALINDAQYELTAIDQVFLKNSREAIWQLMPVNKSYSALEGYQFIPSGIPLQGLRKSLIRAIESNDLRNSWVDSIQENGETFYYPFKYKVQIIAPGEEYPEYSMVFRLAEQLLIRSEALANQNRLPESINDLNRIRQRAGLAELPSSADLSTVLTAIEQERRIELFSEWGHRWLDLKRTNRATPVLQAEKPGWDSHDELLPIPQKELQANPSLTQNAGY